MLWWQVMEKCVMWTMADYENRVALIQSFVGNRVIAEWLLLTLITSLCLPLAIWWCNTLIFGNIGAFSCNDYAFSTPRTGGRSSMEFAWERASDATVQRPIISRLFYRFTHPIICVLYQLKDLVYNQLHLV